MRGLPAWSFESTATPTRWLAVEMTGSPKFLGDPNNPFAHALRLRRDGAFQTVDAEASLFRTTAWPLLRERQRLSQRSELSKLNHMALGLAVYASPPTLPLSTQDSLLAVGQTLPDGSCTRRVTIKGFRFQFTSLSSPFAKLLGATPFFSSPLRENSPYSPAYRNKRKATTCNPR